MRPLTREQIAWRAAQDVRQVAIGRHFERAEHRHVDMAAADHRERSCDSRTLM
jgi:hypothetical protein